MCCDACAPFRRYAPRVVATCLNCGEDLPAGRSTRQYCTRACGQKYRRRRCSHCGESCPSWGRRALYRQMRRALRWLPECDTRRLCPSCFRSLCWQCGQFDRDDLERQALVRRDELPAALAMWVGVSGFICGACRRTPEATLRKRIRRHAARHLSQCPRIRVQATATAAEQAQRRTKWKARWIEDRACRTCEATLPPSALAQQRGWGHVPESQLIADAPARGSGYCARCADVLMAGR